MTREEKRNKLANEVCREIRYQFAHYGSIKDSRVLFEILTKWFSVAKKEKYIRPE